MSSIVTKMLKYVVPEFTEDLEWDGNKITELNNKFWLEAKLTFDSYGNVVVYPNKITPLYKLRQDTADILFTHKARAYFHRYLGHKIDVTDEDLVTLRKKQIIKWNDTYVPAPIVQPVFMSKDYEVFTLMSVDKIPTDKEILWEGYDNPISRDVLVKAMPIVRKQGYYHARSGNINPGTKFYYEVNRKEPKKRKLEAIFEDDRIIITKPDFYEANIINRKGIKQTYKLYMPSLIFTKLFFKLFAFVEEEVYNVPMPNLHSDSRLCTGRLDKKADVFTQVLESVWDIRELGVPFMTSEVTEDEGFKKWESYGADMKKIKGMFKYKANGQVTEFKKQISTVFPESKYAKEIATSVQKEDNVWQGKFSGDHYYSEDLDGEFYEERCLVCGAEYQDHIKYVCPT